MFDYQYYKNFQLDIPLVNCYHELDCIKQYNKDPYLSNNSWNEIVLRYQWKEFYKKEIELWKNKNIQFELIANRVKYIGKGFGQISIREILRGFKISGIYIGNSFHSPLWIKGFIEEYGVSSIYDPCGGWGHRLIGVQCAKNKSKYIYNDINTVSVANIRQMINELEFENCSVYNFPAEEFTPNEDYECVFTCPPYWNTEKYSDNGAENLSYQEFLLWWDKVIKCSIKPGVKYFVYIMNHKLTEDMNKVCLDNGLKLIEQKQLGKMFNHFQRKDNKYDKYEVMNIFQTSF